MGRILNLFGPYFFKFSRSSLSVGLKHVIIGKGTYFSPIDNELLEHLKEKTDQRNSTSYPFIDAFILMYMVRRISSALSFLYS
jgi:hypothetical protein